MRVEADAALGGGAYREFHPENVGIAWNNAVDDFYNAVENGGNAVNAWTDQKISNPVYDWGTGVNDWMDERSTGEKIAISLAPAAAPLLFTEAAGAAYIGAGNLYLQNPSQVNQFINGYAVPGPVNTGWGAAGLGASKLVGELND